jgi:hypothetical protein
VSVSQTALPALQNARTDFGAAALINLATLGTRFTAFLTAPRIDAPQAVLAWRNLPFLPSAVPDHSEAPSWVVTVYGRSSRRMR